MAKNNTLLIVGAALVVGLLVLSTNSNASDTVDNPSGSGANMVSQDQIAATKQLEGFLPKAYKDGSRDGIQLYSIGYGHQIQPDESYLLTATISEAEAEQLLVNDLQLAVNTINNSGVAFSQGQFDGATDFGFNAGVGALQHLIDLFNSGGSDAVVSWLPGAYVHWHPVPGGPAVLNQTNVNRRLQELNSWNMAA